MIEVAVRRLRPDAVVPEPGLRGRCRARPRGLRAQSRSRPASARSSARASPSRSRRATRASSSRAPGSPRDTASAIVNSPGLIDSGYRGEICVVLAQHRSRSAVRRRARDADRAARRRAGRVASGSSRSTSSSRASAGRGASARRRADDAMEPRIRVSAILRWRGRILLLRHEKGDARGLAPARRRRRTSARASCARSSASSGRRRVSSPRGRRFRSRARSRSSTRSLPPSDPYRKHVVHVIFAADVTGSLEDVVLAGRRRARAPGVPRRASSTTITLHPPIQRFLQRWQPGDPAVYLGEMWVP